MTLDVNFITMTLKTVRRHFNCLPLCCLKEENEAIKCVWEMWTWAPPRLPCVARENNSFGAGQSISMINDIWIEANPVSTSLFPHFLLRMLCASFLDNILYLFTFLHLDQIVEGLYYHCSLSVCLSVCLCVWLCLWTKFQPNGYTDMDAVFAKWLLSTLARILSQWMTLGQRSRSQWLKIHCEILWAFSG